MTNGLHELVTAYALDALDTGEKILFEEHLREGCEACEAELRDLRELSGDLARTAATDPPESLKSRLAAKIHHSPHIPGILFDHGGLLLSRSDEMAWQPFAAGIVFKPLFEDASRQYVTLLVRMEPGARYPSHVHTDVEELFVLAGDLQVSGFSMRPGDYCRADLGTTHSETFTNTGCTFLLLASQNNQIVG